MSIAKNASRFDFLPDDADDPFQTASKKNKKKDRTGSNSGDGSKTKASKKGSNSDRKQLQSLAFGSVSEGKKKNKGIPSQVQQNVNTASTAKTVPEQPNEQSNGNSGQAVMQRPHGMSDAQWEEWQKRDANFTDESYATDLEKALMESKLEYEIEQKNKPPGKGKKKKPVAVSLTDFNARLSESVPGASNSVMNGILSAAALGNYNYQIPQTFESDEELVERFRMEARMEVEREHRKAIERQLLMSRQPPPPIVRPEPVRATSPSARAVPQGPMDERDLLIARLSDENLQLKNEVEVLKSRVKTTNNINKYLQAAQEVKDTAKLIYELENLTKMNSDLNEELRQLHSQLEQEKSRSGAAMLELRRLLENRRRTTSSQDH
ncbi:G kinase-anchoring protein 1 [Orchesella cincta]|uniref:G kinase-anchoring protein 1 n=1 Tax=Orchesella cincta TaxID=48709 RepID=A0A1D2NIS6_ORCCI|nr:G kinase-anchoring protein 1 [Orchesella cincta]